MTVSIEVTRQRHEGNGVTTSFSTGFAFASNSHLRVVFTDDDGMDTEWTENVQYTLTGAGTGSPGTLTVKTVPTNYTPAADEFITIIPDIPFTQTLDGDAIDSLPGSAVEDAYDKIWFALGQLKEQLSRALVSDETGPGGEPIVASWLPVVAAVADGSRRVFQIVSWSGGEGEEPDTGLYLGATGYVSNIADAVDFRGPQGASGSGSGDMLAANNLSEVNPATAFATIKQNASETATGVVEMATTAEATTGTDTVRAVTAAGVKAHVDSRVSTAGLSGAYSDLTGKPTLGTAAALDVGTTANKVVQLNGSAQLPALDGSLLTGISTGAMIKLTSGTVSAAATLDLVLTGYTGYRKLILEIINFIPATDTVSLLARVSTNGGSSYDAGASDYFSGAGGVNVTTAIQITSTAGTDRIGSGAAEGVCATLEIPGQTTATVKPQFISHAVHYAADDTAAIFTDRAHIRNAAQDTDAIRILFSSGNITSGKYALYGLT